MEQRGHTPRSTPRKNSPVRPRDAASLVIHRKRRTHHEVLMGRRGSKARFKPGVYVFPGGVLERPDYAARPVRELDPDIPPRMAVAGSKRKACALAMAAVREAFEEAGLMFGLAGEIGAVRHDTWNEFRRRAVSPDLQELSFLGRAITPAYQPLRFHARFFSVDADHFEGDIKGDGELEDLQWVRIGNTAGLELMIVQEMILETLAERLHGRNAPPQRLFFNWGRLNVIDA